MDQQVQQSDMAVTEHNTIMKISDFWKLKYQIKLGDFYYHIQRNYPEAIRLYTLAANQGNTNAQYKLGVYYHYIKQDYPQMKHWYLLAANKGHLRASYKLGFYYDTIERDLITSAYWFRRSI